MKRNSSIALIMNADDLGLHRSVNEAIEKCHRNGVLTSASLVVAGEAFDDAVAVAKRNPRLGVGIHLTLNGEMPVKEAGAVPSLIGSDGRLHESHSKLCLGMLTGKASMRELVDECEAQIVKFLDTGLTPSHVDSHRHVHLFPPITKALRPLFKKYGLRKMRAINIPSWDYSFDLGRIGVALALRHGSAYAGNECIHPDNFVGFFKSGRMDKSYVLSAINKLSPGVTEMNFHPGTDNHTLKERYGLWEGLYGWGCNWERELDILLDQGVRSAIESRGIELVHYGNI